MISACKLLLDYAKLSAYVKQNNYPAHRLDKTINLLEQIELLEEATVNKCQAYWHLYSISPQGEIKKLAKKRANYLHTFIQAYAVITRDLEQILVNGYQIEISDAKAA